jgi:hypothetical protein
VLHQVVEEIALHVSAEALRLGGDAHPIKPMRKILRQLEVPCELVNRPGRGCSLFFRER